MLKVDIIHKAPPCRAVDALMDQYSCSRHSQHQESPGFSLRQEGHFWFVRLIPYLNAGNARTRILCPDSPLAPSSFAIPARFPSKSAKMLWSTRVAGLIRPHKLSARNNLETSKVLQNISEGWTADVQPPLTRWAHEEELRPRPINTPAHRAANRYCGDTGIRRIAAGGIP
jgi:hypothetical protein